MPRRDTLERDVKKRIRLYLDMLVKDGVCYYRMPVPFGFGKKSIDFEGCLRGRFFGIEAKSPDDDAEVTPLQRDTLLAIHDSGGKAFIISRDEGLLAFRKWVDQCCRA